MKVDRMLGKKVQIIGGDVGVVQAVKYHVASGKTFLVRHLSDGGVVDKWFDGDRLATLDGVLLDLRGMRTEVIDLGENQRGKSVRIDLRALSREVGISR